MDPLLSQLINAPLKAMIACDDTFGTNEITMKDERSTQNPLSMEARVKRLFWKSTFLLFANISCEKLIFGSLHSQFLRISCNAHFGSPYSLVFGMSCVKRWFRNDILTFCKCLV